MKRGRSTTTPTIAEAARIVAAKEGPCMACVKIVTDGLLSPDDAVVGCDYNHAKSGNVRRGHMAGYALCVWHHRRHPMEGVSMAAMRAKYGPSLMDGSRLFHETYGTDDELIEQQTFVLEQQEAVCL
ncbi:Ref family recombination enhancement nuclease [Xanthomonas sp. NCPPB 3005]|uniref:Ref family recombination enhancement nuclease n=1 Tax=Xanthomonas sp. NCPPB 3005 TaxID=3240913 RepID=UPI0035141B04